MRCVADVLDLSSMVVLDMPDGGLKVRDPREIERVKQLVGAANRPKQGRPRERGRQGPGGGQPHHAPRGKQRRSMGRSRGR